jgi:hypothetical protein
MWELMIVGLIVLSALVLTIIRIVQFFSTPASKCHGCSGCALKEVAQEKKRDS